MTDTLPHSCLLWLFHDLPQFLVPAGAVIPVPMVSLPVIFVFEGPAVFRPAPLVGMSGPALSSFFRPSAPLLPGAVLVPVTVALPGGPVLLELAVRYSPLPGRQAAIIRRQLDHGAGYLAIGAVAPRPIVGRASEPSPFVGAVPGSRKEEDIHSDRRDGVHIRARYHDNIRRGGEAVWRGAPM